MTHKIKTFEGACKALGINPKSLPDVKALPKKHQKALVAHYKLIIIIEALNEGWEPNWNDRGQYKYFPYFQVEASEKKPAGFGFSNAHYDSWPAGTHVGSRLCLKSYDLALYAGKQFKKEYKDYFLIG